MLNHYVVYLQLIQCYVNYSSVNKKRYQPLFSPIKMVKYIGEKKEVSPPLKLLERLLGIMK